MFFIGSSNSDLREGSLGEPYSLLPPFSLSFPKENTRLWKPQKSLMKFLRRGERPNFLLLTTLSIHGEVVGYAFDFLSTSLVLDLIFLF